MDYPTARDVGMFEEITLNKIISWHASAAIIFGGVVPYIPQYLQINRTKNTEGFSLYVCLALLVANILRILFWFGKPFELPILVQSFIMNIAMLAMIHLCVTVANESQIIKGKDKLFTDFDRRHFWQWSDFGSYLQFLLLFSCSGAFVMYLFLDNYLVVETVGFMSVFVEAMLGVPQFYRNFVNKSTLGMSVMMVVMWTCGDVFKTVYYVLREAPLQFWVCGIMQICVDVAIFLQVLIYGQRGAPRHGRAAKAIG